MTAEPTRTDEQPGDTDVDPQIRAFRRYLADAFGRYPHFSVKEPVEARRIAEAVRAPLTEGGPAMARTVDRTVRTQAGELRVRIHYPTIDPSLPALVYLHGGGWVLFSLNTHDRVMREYAARAGVIVVGVDYALAPEARFPIALTQVTTLVQWLHRHGTTLGIEPGSIAIGGDSAGANLALGSALALRDAGDGALVRALVLNYGVYDNDFDTASYRLFASDDYMLTADEMANFWTQYVRSDADRSNPLACPARASVSGLPASFLAIADCDVLRDENVAMAARLRDAGVPVESTIYPGTTHSFLEAVSMAAISDRAFADTARWLRHALGRDG